MDKCVFASVPTREQWELIRFLESKVAESLQCYKEFHNDIFQTTDVRPTAITPLQYLDFLAQTYRAYESENCKIFPHRVAEAEASLKLAKKSEMPYKALDVVQYADRAIKDDKPFSLSGDRCDYDHTPPTSVVKQAVLEHKLSMPDDLPVDREKLTARAIPIQLHQEFHKAVPKLPDDPYEAAKTQMQWQREGLIQRGYSKKKVLQSEREVHERNEKIGVYR